MDYVIKVTKRIERSVRNTKVAKLFQENSLLHKAHKNVYSFLILSNDPKQTRGYVSLYAALEREGLGDRIVVVRRDAEMG